MKLLKMKLCCGGDVIVNLDKALFIKQSLTYGESIRLYMEPFSTTNYLDIAISLEDMAKKLEVDE